MPRRRHAGKFPKRSIVAELIRVVGAKPKVGVSLEQFSTICDLMPAMMSFMEHDEDDSGFLTCQEVKKLMKSMAAEEQQDAAKQPDQQTKKAGGGQGQGGANKGQGGGKGNKGGNGKKGGSGAKLRVSRLTDGVQ